jgi:two-component system cell cycle sensor histidine kinase/response regulator CckA
LSSTRKRRKLDRPPVDEDLLRTIFDRAATGIAVANAEGQILTCNPALERMLGYSADEWVQRNSADAAHPDDLEKIKELNEALFSGESDALVLEHRFLHKNGEPVWVRASVSLVRDQRGSPFRLIASFEDINERRRAEEYAASANRLTEKLLETTDALVVQLNGAGEIEFVNGAFEEITGYRREDLVGQSWFDLLVPKEHYPEVWEEFQRLTAQGVPTRFENPILTKSGEERYIVWRNSDLDSTGEIAGTISIGIDITERRIAEEELADSEEKLLAVFTSAPAGMAVSNTDDGRILDVNEEFQRIFECRREDIIEKTSIELGLWIDPEDRKRLVELVERDGHASNFEAPLRTLTGRLLTALINARSVVVREKRYLIFATTDVTEARRVEEMNLLLKRSLDLHSDGAYWMDSESRFVYVNDAACRAVGYEREELIGQPLSLIHSNATPENMRATSANLPYNHTYVSEEIHRRKDGSEFPVEISANHFAFDGEDYYCSFARDISERKQLERERVQLNSQLAQAQKMEAVGRLAGGVAHNFSNILTALVGYCELLLGKLPAGADGRQEAEQIKLAADHATSVTRELLLFSRREVARKVRLDLNTVVVQTQLLLRELIRSDIKMVAALAPVVPPVLADRSQIEQVLTNLVVNASDAMPNGGVIAIETAEIELAEPLLEGDATLEAGHYVTLVVKDSGTGMDEGTLARIFEPFFSTKGPETGTGLGLAMVYGIVEESGGCIHVDSKPGAGTRFTIFLPALPARG